MGCEQGSDETVSMEHEIFVVFCTSGQKMPSSSTWERPLDFENAVRGLEWAKGSALGTVAFAKIVRVHPF